MSHLKRQGFIFSHTLSSGETFITFDLSWIIFHVLRICSGVSLVHQTHNGKLSWANICTDLS